MNDVRSYPSRLTRGVSNRCSVKVRTPYVAGNRVALTGPAVQDDRVTLDRSRLNRSVSNLHSVTVLRPYVANNRVTVSNLSVTTKRLSSL